MHGSPHAVHKPKSGVALPVLKNIRPLNEGDVLRYADKKRELETVANDATPWRSPMRSQSLAHAVAAVARTANAAEAAEHPHTSA